MRGLNGNKHNLKVFVTIEMALLSVALVRAAILNLWAADH